jgi:hypothetical protein
MWLDEAATDLERPATARCWAPGGTRELDLADALHVDRPCARVIHTATMSISPRAVSTATMRRSRTASRAEIQRLHRPRMPSGKTSALGLPARCETSRTSTVWVPFSIRSVSSSTGMIEASTRVPSK